MKLTKTYLKQLIKEELEVEASRTKPTEEGPKNVATIADAYGDFVKSGKTQALYAVTQERSFKGRLHLMKKDGEISAIFSDMDGNSRITGDIANPQARKVEPIKY